MAEITVTAANFAAEVENAATPVLLDFWASWCGPCRMVAPVVAEFAEKYAGQVKVGKVNVDDEPELAARFGVMSIPTIILFKDGQPVKTSVGYAPLETLEQLLS